MDLAEIARIALYGVWLVMAALIIKVLIYRKRWRHPFRGNGPVLFALLLVLISVEWTRARNIADAPPPYVPALALSWVATLLLMYWLWRQMELIPRWIRTHIPWRRTTADYTIEEHDDHAHERPGSDVPDLR